jgi:arylsulfatase A-like enzyme
MIGRREFICLTGTAAATAVLPRIRFQSARPNLLFILADDLGYGDLSSFGRRDYATPDLDTMAQGGVRFTQAYSGASVCTPTRGAFLTGRYPARLPAGLQQPLSWVNDRDGLPPSHPTIASRLRAAGYHTSLIGKWHLGYLPQFGPLRHGFEEFFGILSGGVDYYTHRDALDRPDLHEGLVPVERVGYLTDLLTERAVEYVTRRHDAPFYLSLHYTAPHWPWQGPGDERLSDTTKSGFEGGHGSPEIYARMVRSLDAGVGRVLRALADSGIERDTLVIFTSDNGGERYSFNWPHQQAKGTLWEGGIRVPAIARWPGTLPRGKVSQDVAITMDWTATLLAAAGVAPDPGYPLDGVSQLDQPGAGSQERLLFWRQPALRFNGAPPQEAVRRGKWKFLAVHDREFLFDLAADPGERTNRARREPGLAAELKAALRGWKATLPDPEPEQPR